VTQRCAMRSNEYVASRTSRLANVRDKAKANLQREYLNEGKRTSKCRQRKSGVSPERFQ
jgi:hypothetical protein